MQLTDLADKLALPYQKRRDMEVESNKQTNKQTNKETNATKNPANLVDKLSLTHQRPQDKKKLESNKQTNPTN